MYGTIRSDYDTTKRAEKMQDPASLLSELMSAAAAQQQGRAAAGCFPEQELLKCPRCDSPNTKFCYYNNYNLSQPRHFCKSCRRYWTKGGTLRNVPVGGASRKPPKRPRRDPDPAPAPPVSPGPDLRWPDLAICNSPGSGFE